MEANELRQLGVAELKGRIKGWREELFRSRFKGQTAEARDTSIYRKLKRDIARALTIMNQKALAGDVEATTPSTAPVEDKPREKKVTQAASKATSKKEAPEAPKKTAKAKTTKKKKAE